MKKLYILFTSILLTSLGAHAQLGTDVFSVAEDNAGNYASWNNGDNQGNGFASWSLNQIGGGHYAGSSGVGNPSLAIFSSGFGNFSSATRNFNSPLKQGDTFSVDVGHTTTIIGEIFLQLLDNGSPVITLKFVGGTSDWQLNDGGSDFTIGQPYSANSSITFTFTYNEDGTYSYTFGSASGSNFTATSTISNINGFKFQSNDQGSGENFGINNLLIESKYTIANNSTVSSSGDITIPYLDVQSGSTLNIPSNSSVTVSGDFNNSGTVNLTSTSTVYPSLIVNGSASGNATYNRFVNSNILGNDLIAPPVSGQTWSSFLDPVNATALLDGGGSPIVYAFAPFDKTTGDYENYNTNTVATLTSGTAYRVATDAGETIAFNGTIPTGTITSAVSNSGPDFAEWNLIGNPYPSYLNVQDFLNNATNGALFDPANVAIYGYDGSASNGWTVLNLANTTTSTSMTPGQGFFVAAQSNGSMEFTASMRRTGNSDDFILGRNEGLVYLMLQLSSSTETYKTDFYFNSNATLGLDPGYDATLWGGNAPSFSIYSHLVDGNTGAAMAIQTLGSTDIMDVTIPLGVNANQGEQLTFSISEMSLPESVNVYLDDTVTNISTLLNSNDYVITPSVDLVGTGRFYLRMSEDALSITENTLDQLNIYTLKDAKQLVVNGQLQENTTLNLYDIQGRQVLSTELDSTSLENRIDVSQLSGGVYVVNVQNDTQQKSQKVIIR